MSERVAFVPCPLGTWSSATGQASNATCTACSRGKFSSISGATSEAQCTKCPANFVQPLSGASSLTDCQPCPPFSQSSSGSIDIADCLCDPGAHRVALLLVTF